MGIPDGTVVQLVNEGITTVDYLVDFDKKTIQQVADSLQRPGGKTPDPTPNASPGAMIPTPPFVFREKSQKRLITACDIVRYYETTGQGITTDNILWNTVIKNFEAEWKALMGKKNGDEPDVPKITNTLSVIK